jgi:dynein heavy chain
LSIQFLADPNFLSRMKNLNVYAISKPIQTKIKAKIESNPMFVPNEIKNISFAAKSMCEWVRAVASFTDVWKQIEKKKKYVEDKNAELDSALAKLKIKQDELNAVVSKVNELEESFNKNKREKEKIDNDIQMTEQRLQNASQLTEGLADEEVRWKETLVVLTEDLTVLVGNAFIAGASVSYYGPFTGQFR